MSDEHERDEWTTWWNARVAAFEKILGKHDDIVLHGIVPFQFGAEVGGAADLIRFRQHIDGVVYVTCELIGCEGQQQNSLGNYELMICHRNEDEWGPSLIADLAQYTLEAEISPGETMDIGPTVPEESTIEAFLFDGYATFEVLGRKAGLLLCVGITGPELRHCHAHGSANLLEKLKAANIYPFTDLNRKSII